MELFKIGWRNLRRNKRRTALNVIALAIGTAIMILSVAWVRGYFTSFYDGIIGLDTGHAQILPKGYLAERRRLPLDLVIADYAGLRQELLAVDGVEDAAARISFSAQIGDGRRATRMLARAIEPDRERAVTVVADHIETGSYLASGQSGVLMSSTMAERFGIEPGDPLFITAMDASGAENFTETVLVGTFRLGYPAIDETLFYMDMPSAQKLLGMENEATRLVLKLDSGPGVAPFVEELQTKLTNLGRDDLVVESWRVFVEVIVSAVEADTAGFSMILAVLFLLVVIGMLNSMSMAVQERTKEIGTLRAIGMRRGQLTRLFLAEGVSIALLGAAVGALLAGIASIYFGVVGIDLSALAGTGLPIPFGDRFTADFRVWDFLLAVLVSLATATVGSLLPTRRAGRLQIADALGGHLQ